MAPKPEARHESFLERISMGQTDFDAKGELCILEGRLYLASLKHSPTPDPKKYYITLTQKMRYVPYCADFGPFNLGTLHHICQALYKTINNEKGCAVLYYTTRDPIDITNAIFLLGAFLCLKLGATPNQAWRPFSRLPSELVLPYRDATWVKSTYDLHVRECWAGLVKAVKTGIYVPATFDKNEYFYYDDPDNGDLHMVVPGKFLAFRGPREVEDGRGSLEPADFVEVFKSMGVQGIVRLNKSEYDKSTFLDAGFAHYDMVFDDCSVPPSKIVDKFLRRAEALRHGQVLAVHCLAGLGRTGTLIALYMMKHYRFTADEAMGWLRVCRPGSIIGPQQRYLADMESKMHQLGNAGVQGLGDIVSCEPVKRTFGRTASQEKFAPTSSLEQSKVLAEMVTDGMWNRKAQRLAQKDKYDGAGAVQHAASTRSFLPWLGKTKPQPSSGPKPHVTSSAGASKAGLVRSKSGGELDKMANNAPRPATLRPPGAQTLPSPMADNINQRFLPSPMQPRRDDVGYGGNNSLKKSGSFNNMTCHMGERLLSSSSVSSASSENTDRYGDDDDNEALEQFLAEFERQRSAGEEVPTAVGQASRQLSGSLCFGGMDKLHANALQRLAAERSDDDGAQSSCSTPPPPASNSSSVSSSASGTWSLLSYFKKGDRGGQ